MPLDLWGLTGAQGLAAYNVIHLKGHIWIGKSKMFHMDKLIIFR